MVSAVTMKIFIIIVAVILGVVLLIEIGLRVAAHIVNLQRLLYLVDLVCPKCSYRLGLGGAKAVLKMHWERTNQLWPQPPHRRGRLGTYGYEWPVLCPLCGALVDYKYERGIEKLPDSMDPVVSGKGAYAKVWQEFAVHFQEIDVVAPPSNWAAGPGLVRGLLDEYDYDLGTAATEVGVILHNKWAKIRPRILIPWPKISRICVASGGEAEGTGSRSNSVASLSFIDDLPRVLVPWRKTFNAYLPKGVGVEELGHFDNPYRPFTGGFGTGFS